MCDMVPSIGCTILVIGYGRNLWWPPLIYHLPLHLLGIGKYSELTNVDEMKDLWCSSTVWLLSTQT